MKLPKALAKYLDVVNHPAAYLKMEVERVKTNMQARIADIITKVVIFAALGIVALFVLVFGSVTLGLYLNSVLESSFLGFLIVTGFYVLVLILLLLVKDKDRIVRSWLGFAKKNVAVSLREPRQFEQDPLPKNGVEHTRKEHIKS